LREALLANARQIETYLKEYSTRYSEFNSADFQDLMKKFSKIHDKELSSNQILQLLHNARELCKSIWARFDENSMVLGACLISTMCMFLLNTHRIRIIMLFLTTITYCVFYFIAKFQNMILTFSSFLLMLHIIYSVFKGKIGIISLISVLYPLLYFSNSFVISEDTIVLYLFSTVIALISIRSVQQTYSECSKKPVKVKKSSRGALKLLHNILQVFKRPSYIFATLVASVIVIVRAVFLFRVCRPEQFWCFAQEPQLHNYADANTSSTSLTIHAIDDFFDFNNTWTR